jgi:hypothetical protein
MIQPLRRAHLAIWVVIPALLAVLFFAGLTVRRISAPANPGVHWERQR